MTAKKYQLCVVAHPDDETIFFGGLILDHNKLPWKVICLTDGNADGAGDKRKKNFESACQELGAEAVMLSFSDVYDQRLPVDQIFVELAKLPVPEMVYTHGPLGEYGHPHHQDVSYAVHRYFNGICPVHSVAYNFFPDELVELTEKTYEKKKHILTRIYASEFERFAHLIPATFSEGFKVLNLSEVETIYNFLVKKTPLDPQKIPNFKHLKENIEGRFATTPKRPF